MTNYILGSWGRSGQREVFKRAFICSRRFSGSWGPGHCQAQGVFPLRQLGASRREVLINPLSSLALALGRPGVPEECHTSPRWEGGDRGVSPWASPSACLLLPHRGDHHPPRGFESRQLHPAAWGHPPGLTAISATAL